MSKIQKEIDAIKSSLGNIQEVFGWMIKAEQRFRKGQRVTWTDKARSQGWPRRKCATKGTVKGTDGFCVLVKLDGIKHPRRMHHAFFNPVSGPKMF